MNDKEINDFVSEFLEEQKLIDAIEELKDNSGSDGIGSKELKPPTKTKQDDYGLGV